MIGSPYSYVAKTSIVVLSIKMDKMMKEYESLHPKMLLALQKKLSSKLSNLSKVS